MTIFLDHTLSLDPTITLMIINESLFFLQFRIKILVIIDCIRYCYFRSFYSSFDHTKLCSKLADEDLACPSCFSEMKALPFL